MCKTKSNFFLFYLTFIVAQKAAQSASMFQLQQAQSKSREPGSSPGPGQIILLKQGDTITQARAISGMARPFVLTSTPAFSPTPNSLHSATKSLLKPPKVIAASSPIILPSILNSQTPSKGLSTSLLRPGRKTQSIQRIAPNNNSLLSNSRIVQLVNQPETPNASSNTAMKMVFL